MKHLFLIILSIFAALTARAQDMDNACEFDKFEYKAIVHADNSWSIHETITANFLEKRHGIFQYIELPFMAELGGESREFMTDVTDINVEGDKFKVTSEEGGRYSVIRIGNKYRTITGRHVYNIDYTLHFFDDGCANADMLYISVLGAQWQNFIKEFSFAIQFEKPLPAGFADSLQVYSGALGDTSDQVTVNWEVDTLNNCIVGNASPVFDHNGITLRATLPEGFWDMTNVGIAPTVPVAPVIDYETDSGMDLPTKSLLGLTFLAFLAALMYLLTHRRRNPIVSVEYSAPDNLSSAEIGYIVDNTADVSDLSSLIVWWASKGYVAINEEQADGSLLGRLLNGSAGGSDIILTVRKPLPDDAPEYQQKFWNIFFSNSDKCSISSLGDEHEAILSALISLIRSYTGDKKLTQIDKTAAVLTAVFFLLVIITLLYTTTDSYKDVLYIVAIWLAGFFFNGYFIDSMLEKGFSTFFSKKNKKNWLVLPCTSIVSLAFTSHYASGGFSLPYMAMMSIQLAVWVLSFFIYHMKKNTPYRMEMLSRILGFKEFIRAAEMPMLKAMVDENPSYFYDVLPYAIAFGLSDKWCAQFEGINIEAPDWYTIGTVDSGVSNLSMTNGLMMAQSLTDTFDNVIAASIQSSSIDPSSSGSGSFLRRWLRWWWR